jgi:hypothetical protein
MMKVFVAVIAACVLAISAQAQPRLEVTDPDFDFGYVPQNTRLVHRYWFKSVGTDTLRIKDIKTGCSCAILPLEKNWIAPGDSMSVSFYWEIKRGIARVGRTARIFTNAGPDPIRLHLEAMMLPFPDSARPVTVKPYRCELAKTSRTVIDSVSFTLANYSDRDLAVTMISPPVDECEVVVPDSLKALSNSTGYVKVKPEYADTEFEASITLKFSDQKSTRLTIPIRRKFYLASTTEK